MQRHQATSGRATHLIISRNWICRKRGGETVFKVNANSGWWSAETMPKMLDPFRFVLICVAGWMNHINSTPSSICAKRTGYFGLNPATVVFAQPGTEGKVARTKAEGGNHCHARHLAELASEAHREQVRRWPAPQSRSAGNGKGDRSVGRPYGK
jgi:hypothetical protein